MKKDLNVSYQELFGAQELADIQAKLVLEAEQALVKAYAVYSGFQVGAAVLLDDGSIVTGNNQENASFPAGTCAERVAVQYASSQFPERTIRIIAIMAKKDGHDLTGPVPPCGICRQVVSEYEAEQGSPIQVILATTDGPVHIFDSMRDLLPFHFHEASLKRSS